MRQIDVAVIGGGPCGASVCFGLQTVLGPSAKIEIFERQPKLLPVGGIIHITQTNLERVQNALQDGLHDEFRAISHVRKNMKQHDQFGNLIRDVIGKEIEVVSWYGIQNLLINKLNKNSVNLGYKLLSLDQLSDGVVLKFENSEQIKAKLVLGADGNMSQTRKLIFDEESSKYAGQCIWRLQCSGFHPDVTEGNNSIFLGEGKTLVIQCTPFDSKQGQFRTYVTGVADWPKERLPELQLDRLGDSSQVMRRFIQLYKDFPNKYLEWITQNVDNEVSIEQAAYYRDPTAPRGVGRVSLMGDAAVVFPTGWRQGLAMAFEDAVEISHCIQGFGVSEESLREYEKRRAHRLQPVQEQLLEVYAPKQQESNASSFVFSKSVAEAIEHLNNYHPSPLKKKQNTRTVASCRIDFSWKLFFGGKQQKILFQKRNFRLPTQGICAPPLVPRSYLPWV